MTRRERAARERVITAVLAIAELEATFGVLPGPDSAAARELAAARSGLYQVMIGQGRRG